MSSITVYQKPTCTTCRKLHALLTRKNVAFEAINYYFDPLTKDVIKDLLFKLRMSAKELMRTKENIYKELKIEENNFSEEHLIDLMEKHPDLIQRPIVVRGGKAVLARPIEKVLDLIK